MQKSRVKRYKSRFLTLVMLCSLIAIFPPMASAEIAPGTGVSVDATPVTMDDGTRISETVSLRCLRAGTNIPPPAPGAEINFDYSGNTIRVENDSTGLTYAAGGGWIKWANVDLKAGVASYKLLIASNGASRTFDVRISKPGEGIDAAVSLGTLPVNGLATNWTARWVRYPSASIAGQNAPFIHANTNNYNPPAEETSWATIADSKLDGICDVYFIFPTQDSQFIRLSLTLKEAPVDPTGPYQGNLVFNTAPSAAAATVTLQNLATGATLTPTADGRSFNNVAPGTYGYIVSAAGYSSKIGTVDVTGAHTISAPLIKNLLLWPSQASALYDVTIAARPTGASVAITSLDGNTTYQPQENGKTYSLQTGFYKYRATADGHITKADQVFMVDRSKKVYVVLIPSGGVNNRFEAENIAAGNRPGSNVLSNAQYSGGQAITLGGAADNWATFTNIPSEYSGIAEVKIGHSGVTSGYVNVRVGSETPKTVALDPSGTTVVYIDIMDGNNSIRISSAPTGFILDWIDVWSLTTAGSVDPSEMEEPFVFTKNPIIKSLFTADPEAHVWPTNRDRLMLYPSHDRYPQNGCNRMDMYHVFSTYDLVNFEDQGEILRRNDLPSWATKNTGINADSFMWAPDAAYYDGYYYYYNPVPRQTSNWGSTWETSVVRSIYPDRDFEQIPASDVQENPDKPWLGYLRDSGAMDGYSNMYDVCVRVYDDRIYCYNGASQTLWQCELKSDMVTVVGGKMELVSTNNRTTATNNGDPDAYNRLTNYHEGPSAFRRNGIYYLIYPGSAGSYGGLSGDSFYYCMADSPLGPWRNAQIFFNPHGNTTSHGSVVEFKGEYYWVYHTGNLPGGTDQIRSVCMDKIEFQEDGRITRFTRTFDGVPGLDDVDYVKPTGIKYGPTENANANVTWGSGVTKNKDAAAENGGWILNNVGAAASSASEVTLTFNLEKAQRARLRFHYSTKSDMPKLNLTVNGVDHNTVNFMKTGGKSFFADVEFTPRKLQAGVNTIVLGGSGAATSSQTGGNITLNYIEVIPLDEDEPTGLELRRSGTHVSLINYTTDVVDNVTLIYAIYNAKGQMVYIDTVDDVSVDGKRASTTIFDVDLSEYEGCTAKAYAWNTDTFVPICASATDIVMHNQYELGYAPTTP